MTSFGRFVAAARARGALVVQPRMGFSEPVRMRAGLRATKGAADAVAGTLTIDSYTRVGDEPSAVRALDRGVPLNGYPITSYSPDTSRWMLDGIEEARFPVQVRHGSARPQRIVAALARLGLTATEGGPVSYCLPYGRTPLVDSVRNWQETCEQLAALRTDGAEPHLESFGGCMLGQLCPPGLLVAISALEGVFFHRAGLRSISLSYAQQTSVAQDQQAIRALRRLAADLLPETDWHIVVYTYMGVYPRSTRGAHALLEDSATLAVTAGAQRLIVKTAAEAHRIPTVAENVRALRIAADAAARAADRSDRSDRSDGADDPADNPVYAEARALVDAVLDLDADLGTALSKAFERGYLDVPFCLHPDNAGRSRSHIDETGRLTWSDIGAMPIGQVTPLHGSRLTAAGLHDALTFVQRRYDDHLDHDDDHTPAVPLLQEV
ncbi:methylaspartate mutase [Streptomyces sp. NBC_01754]|uniref:methylaspartate mutase n=1 Tax=Streptomyces sp. NBC_01754 TaxID=2975930 RepID=UPI002DD916F5|nr:methylaspartate mutase [Streptomyces sp. NBC_01754]WSC90858.1 methylaspartate mutase [Streptomyces sp. NBC_01754]WSC96647.1 methylaspartate mutase [Streptomyces sp. NBC_01754]